MRAHIRFCLIRPIQPCSLSSFNVTPSLKCACKSCFCDGSTGNSFWENTASYWMTEISRGVKTDLDLLRGLLQMQSPNVPKSHMRNSDLYLTPSFSHRPRITAVKQTPACTPINFRTDMINKFGEVNLILMQRLWRDSSNILLHASPPPMKFSLRSHGVGSTQNIILRNRLKELTQCAWLIFSTPGTGKKLNAYKFRLSLQTLYYTSEWSEQGWKL